MLQPKQTPKQKKNIKDATQMKNMRPTGPTSGRVKPTLGKAKNGKSFPDLNKDGKITKADILKGRGVIAKNGKPVEKAFLGKMLGGVGKSVLGGLAGQAIGGLMGGKGKGGGLGGMLGGLLGGKNGKTIKKSQNGSSTKKVQGVKGMSENEKLKKGITRLAPVKKAMKSGGSMKKCKYGCK